MIDQIGMRDGQFLELLNKPNRSMQEENDLQVEIKRRQELENAQKASQAQPEANQPVAEPSQPENTPAQPQTAQEVNTQDAHVSVPENLQTPAPAPEQQVEVTPPSNEEQTEEEPYTLTELVNDTQNAIAYLKTLDQTDNVKLAANAFETAAYLLSK